MAHNFNSTQFVKTYGKPRRTLGVGHDSLWHNDLVDDFDKCMGIDDVKPTTFISPESTSSITNYPSTIHKKTEKKIQPFSGWSMHLHSTLADHKTTSTSNKRNIDRSFNSCNKKKQLLKNTEKKKRDISSKITNSNCSPTLNTKYSDIAYNSKITSTLIKYPKNKFMVPKGQSSTPLRTSVIYNRAKKLNNSSSKKKKKKIKLKKKLTYDSNTQYSLELCKKPDYSCLNSSNLSTETNNECSPFGDHSFIISGSHRLKSLNNNHKTKHQSSVPDYNKEKIISDSLDTKNSNWYNKVMNVFCVENAIEEYSHNKHKVKEIRTIDKSLENHSSESIIIYDDDITAVNKFIVNGPTNKDDKLPQPNQLEILSLSNKSSCTIQNIAKFIPLSSSYNLDTVVSHDSSTNDVQLQNMLDLSENIKSTSFVNNCNQTSHLSVNNISLQSSACNISNSDSKILVDITNRFSDIKINNKTILNDQSSNTRNILKSSDKLTLKHSLNSNNSSSIINSSSSSDQETVIYNEQNCIDNFPNVNTDSNNLFLGEKESLETFSKCSFKKDSLKCNNLHSNIINTSDDGKNISDQILHTTVHNQSLSYIVCRPNIFICKYNDNTKFDDSCVEIQKKCQSNCDEMGSLLNQSENISSIKYNKKTSSEDQTNIANSIIKTKNSNTFKNITRRRRFAGHFQNSFNSDSIEISAIDNNIEIQNSIHRLTDYTHSTLYHENLQTFRLEPGKKWRRSILIVRNFIGGNSDQTTSFLEDTTTKGRNWNSRVDDVLRKQSINTTTINQRLDQSNTVKKSMCRSSQYLQRYSTDLDKEIAKKYIFNACEQQKPISFESWLMPKCTRKWKKVGEGVYGEVFRYTVSRSSTVVKIIPIEGTSYINSERQKMMFEVYSEILIATELNSLSNEYNWNKTNSFCKLKNISCVQGKYPKQLIELWKQYDNDKGSDNDNPNILPENQLFMVLEMEDGGIDVECYLFNSAYQALFAFLQVVFGLAVAEQQYNFEHRDLHIGNVLVRKCVVKHITYKLDGQNYIIPSGGIKITIIDFTLSRMTYYNKQIYNDLADDPELFTSDGDYQFEVYRLMKKETNDQWALYKPKTNIYWLYYILDKMLQTIHYKKTTTIIHNKGLKHLQKLKNSILSFDSAKHFAESNLVSELLEQ